MIDDGKKPTTSPTARMEINRDSVRALIEKHRIEIRSSAQTGGNVHKLVQDHSDQITAILRGRPLPEIEKFLALHKEENEAVKQADLAKIPDIFTHSIEQDTSQIADQSFRLRKNQLQQKKQESAAKAWACFLSVFLAIVVIYSALKK